MQEIQLQINQLRNPQPGHFEQASLYLQNFIVANKHRWLDFFSEL